MLNWYMRTAQRTGLTSGATGRNMVEEDTFAKVFGLTASTFEDKDSEAMIRKAAAAGGITDKHVLRELVRAAASGGAEGVAKQFLGDDMVLGGAGKMGSLEGRFLQIMSNETFGERGSEMATDFFARMKAYDLGPEGGEKGGKILFTGTPEEIVHHKQSYTGKYLNKIL